jgi:hypothetical protein
LRVTFAPDSRRDARRIRESDANVARTCRARSARQGMHFLNYCLKEKKCFLKKSDIRDTVVSLYRGFHIRNRGMFSGKI